MGNMGRTYPETSKCSTWEFHQQTPNRKEVVSASPNSLWCRTENLREEKYLPET